MYFLNINDTKYEIIRLEVSQSESSFGYAQLIVALADGALCDEISPVASSIGEVYRENIDYEKEVIISGEVALMPVDGGLYFAEIIAQPMEKLSLDNTYPESAHDREAVSLLCDSTDDTASLIAEYLSAYGEVLCCDMRTRQVHRSAYFGNTAEAYVLERDDISHVHVSYHERPIGCVNLEVICQYDVHESELLDVVPEIKRACGGAILSLNVIDWQNVLRPSQQCLLVSNTMKAVRRKKLPVSKIFTDVTSSGVAGDATLQQYLYDGSLIFHAAYDRQHREKTLCRIFASGDVSEHMREINLRYVVHISDYVEASFFLSDLGREVFMHCVRKAAQHIVTSERNQSMEFRCAFDLLHRVTLGSSVIVKGVCGKDICGKVVKISAVAEEHQRFLRVKISYTYQQMWEQAAHRLSVARKNGVCVYGGNEIDLQNVSLVGIQDCVGGQPLMQIDDVQVRNVGDEQIENLKLYGGDFSSCDTKIALRIKKSSDRREEDVFQAGDFYIKAGFVG